MGQGVSHTINKLWTHSGSANVVDHVRHSEYTSLSVLKTQNWQLLEPTAVFHTCYISPFSLHTINTYSQ